MKPKTLTTAIISGSITSAIAMQVQAQQADFALEEIIVTAQKRETALQETSATIVALSDNALSERSVVGLEDLHGVLPGAAVGTDELGLELTIRGVSNGAGQTGEPSIAFHSDGVYSTVPTALFYDLERLEVIYGPQGTLYGRNATGGALNAISNKPQADEFYGNIEHTIGNYSRNLTKAMVNVPVLKDVLALRAAGVIEGRDGYSTNSLTNERAGKIDDRSSTRISLGYTPSENLTLIVRAITNKLKGTEGDGSIHKTAINDWTSAPGMKQIRANLLSFLSRMSRMKESPQALTVLIRWMGLSRLTMMRREYMACVSKVIFNILYTEQS